MSDYKQNPDVSRLLEACAKYKADVQTEIANIQQEAARQNQRNPPNVQRNQANVLKLAQNAPIQEAARQKQRNPPNVQHNQAKVLMLSQSAPGNPHNLSVLELKVDERLLDSKTAHFHFNQDTYHINPKQEEGHSKSYIKTFLVHTCIQVFSSAIISATTDVYLSPYESLHWIPPIKFAMHNFNFALDASEAWVALHNCIKSKELKISNKAGLTSCWEEVYDKFGKKATILVVKGTPTYMNEPLTKPQFFDLLEGNPQTNSVELTPWIADLTPKEICALIDENRNGAIELGEVEAAKRNKFLVVVAGLEDQKHLAKLNIILTDDPDTHSQCIAWLNTLPRSNPQIEGPTFLKRLGSNVARTVLNYGPMLVMCYFTGPAGAGTLARVAHVVAHASVSHVVDSQTWIPEENVLPEIPAFAGVKIPAFTGPGNTVGNGK